ncbi:hypothetical protein F4679DRAFT_568445 [Xylaria curta]|nr:hypothetical protein F4679DRAFT_568445 [Xylaria curta]
MPTFYNTSSLLPVGIVMLNYCSVPTSRSCRHQYISHGKGAPATPIGGILIVCGEIISVAIGPLGMVSSSLCSLKHSSD